MADILNALGKAKKVTLLPGWVERFSKKHPDRPFYFNEKTGESRWSLPSDPSEKAKGVKRKNAQRESEESSECSEADRLLNAIDPHRPKLKARGTKKVISNQTNSNKDTPAMRLMREKLEQRKAALTPKKGASKANQQKKQQNVASPKNVSQISSPSTAQNQRRTRRTCSVISSNESVSSNCSTISNASSMGAKIKAAAVSIPKSPSKANKASLNSTPSRLPKITKIQSCSVRLESAKLNSPDSEILSDDLRFSSASSNDDTNDITTTRRSTNNNLANQRLENFRKRLSLEGEKEAKRLRKSSPVINNNKDDSSECKSKLLNSPTPIFNNKAQIRLYSLENRVKNNGLLVINQSKLKSGEDNIKSKQIIEKIEDAYCEEMEWEPIEEEKIISEIHSARFQLCEKPSGALSELSSNALQAADNTGETHALYVVIDTNVFLSNLAFVEEVRDSHSDIYGRPFIVVPWTVIRELDFIKDDKNNTRSQALKLKARRAVDFLNKHFSSKHPRFLGQTPNDVENNKKKFMIECPDDEILQTCLQIKESSKSPVLVTYDKNLSNKAAIHDIPTIGRHDRSDMIFFLKAAETTEFLSNSLHAQLENQPDEVKIMKRELDEAEDIMEEGKAVLKAVLSEVVAKEMEILFGSRWEMHLIIRPPWTVETVLKCALKHWMAAVSESFTRRTESMLRQLQDCIKNIPHGGRKLQDVKYFLDNCADVIQTLDANKYPSLKPLMLQKLDDLEKRCSNTIEEIKNCRFKEIVGNEEDPCEVERRASLAFTVLENIYAFARDACGISADALGLQCAFSYNKLHPFLTPQIALQYQQDIGVSVNHLLQSLRAVLNKIEKDIRPNDKVIIDLHEMLINFNADLRFEELSQLTPLDVFCCVKLRKSKLDKGYQQLQELAIHFCRMANFQCK